MRIKKILKISAVALAGVGIIWQFFYRKEKIDPLSVEALYGRWQIVDARGYYFGEDKLEVTKETFAHIGKTVEFHKDYIIVDSEQCSNLRYIYYTCCSFDKQKPLEEETYLQELNWRIDYWYENVDKKSDYIIIRPSRDGTYHSPRWFYDRYTLIANELYIGYGTGFLLLERIPDRPWWQRLQSYIQAVRTPKYDATKIVPQEMWGTWEVTDLSESLKEELKKSSPYETSKWDAETFEEIRGARFTLHPKYVIINGKQYNNPRYSEETRHDKTKVYFLDDYNGYKMEGYERWKGYFSVDKDGDLWIYRNYLCRRLPPLSLWQRMKYYCKYLFGIDDSGKGDFFDQRLKKNKT